MRYLLLVLILLGAPAWCELVTDEDKTFSLELPADWTVLAVKAGHVILCAPNPQLSVILVGVEPEPIKTEAGRDSAREVMKQAVAGQWKSLEFAPEESTLWGGLKGWRSEATAVLKSGKTISGFVVLVQSKNCAYYLFCLAENADQSKTATACLESFQEL
ncbi:MAG: hypothetical protein KC910_11960 [Candidatus Eremiobacteraeota bacterium]|nr:hypothetical protein [Candidatus Eremiobacteraeota bacterium]